uniref:Uncharacterized protein n=1 Tax=Oryza nivara TaxID=4536 RepID=A0A0E0GT87_ORYNI
MVLQGAGKSIGSWKQQCKLGFLSIVALRVPSSGLCTQELLARFPLHFSLSSIGDDEQPTTIEINYFFCKLEGACAPIAPCGLRSVASLHPRCGEGKIEEALLVAVDRDVLIYKESCVVTSSTAPPPPVTTMAETVDFASGDAAEWRAALAAYDRRLAALGKPDLVEVDSFYRRDLPDLLRRRDPEPFLAKPELVRLLQWKLSRGKWRPRLMDFVKGLEDAVVESASCKAFAALPDLRKAITELTVLKGVGPATASAVLAAYAPDVAPFMSDEAMVAALGNAKEYTLKQYLAFAEKLQTKSKELSSGEEVFTTSDVERALWSSAVASKSLKAPPGNDLENKSKTHGKRKR